MTVPDRSEDGVGSRRQQWLMCFALFAVGYSAQGISPIMLLYTRELELSTTMLTVFFTVYAIGLMFAFVFGGPLSDRYGRKRVVVPSMCLIVVSMIGLLAAASLGEPMILIARFVQGLASGAVFTVGTVWLRELVGTKNAAGAAARASAFQALGFGIGPFLSALFVQWLPWKHALTILVILTLLIPAILVARVLPETMTRHRSGRIQIGLPAGTRGGYIWYLVPCGLCVYAFAMLSILGFPIQIGNAGFDQVYVILGMSALVVQVGAVVAAGIAKRLGPSVSGWLAGATGAAGCALGVLAVQPGGWLWVIPATALIGLGTGLAMTSGVMVSDLLAPPDRRGALISMFYIAVYVGYSSGTILSLIWGPNTMEQPETVAVLGVAAVVLAVILAVPGRAVVRRARERHAA
ncbi:MAG: MFS transporter [Cumulibacter sp.]